VQKTPAEKSKFGTFVILFGSDATYLGSFVILFGSYTTYIYMHIIALRIGKVSQISFFLISQSKYACIYLLSLLKKFSATVAIKE
jgi:hypothetical protein